MTTPGVTLDDRVVKALDPGIRSTVVMLTAHGFKTTDSGDGVSKPPDGRVFDFPHVACVVSSADMMTEADRLWLTLGEGWRIEASYCPNDGTAILFAMRPEEPK